MNRLKAGDKVYIRDDLKSGKEYGADTFQNIMKTRWVEVAEVEDSGSFSVLGDKYFTYTPEMVNWDKTRELQGDSIMKTSKEMQLKIIDKMRENVESDLSLMDGIYAKSCDGCILDDLNTIGFSQEMAEKNLSYFIPPSTITINGVEIPKPLEINEINPGAHYYFMPCLSANLCTAINGYDGQKFEYKLLYETKEEAITASKLLFGIDGDFKC